LRLFYYNRPIEEYSGGFVAILLSRKRRGAQAVDILGPALQRNPNNPVLLRTAGEAYLAIGDAARAASSYERANAVDKNNVGSQVRLAQVRLAAGETERAFSDLESLAAGNASQYQADLALFSAHLRRRQYDQALAVVDALEKKQPKAAMVSNLRGTVYLAKRDLKKARASFEKALEMEPDFLPAAQNLVVIDLQEGNVQAARGRYDRMLAKNPKNEALLLASAELLTMSGAPPEQVKAAIEKAVAANPTSVRARQSLIGYESRQRDTRGVLAATQAALAAIPDDPQLTQTLGIAQLAAGESNQAIETFKKLVALQPQNPMPLVRLAETQAFIKDYPAAIESSRKALALQPDSPQALVVLTKIYLASGRPEAALAEARRLQKEQPDKVIGYALEGELLSSQKKWVEAAAAFKSALARQPTATLATRYYVSLQMAGKAADAGSFAKKWIGDHPNDPSIPLFLAQQSQRQKDFASAKSGYEKVLAMDSDNAIALNNLAVMLADEKDPKALEYAERAHRVAPFDANILDTLGWTLTRTGDVKRGVTLLRMATRMSPFQGEIRLHLAKALAQSGDKSGARQEIGELTKLNKASPVRIEAEKLQATL
jgi:putative PEP-CTERM system TPR-repeat lipoprotein